MLSRRDGNGIKRVIIDLKQHIEYAYQIPYLPYLQREMIPVFMTKEGFLIDGNSYTMDELIAIMRFYERERYFHLESSDSSITNEQADEVKLQLEKLKIYSLETVHLPFDGAC